MNETGILGVRAWRVRKGISLDQIAASTKLSTRQLEAIESGDFKRLPGGIYNTNYIRQYAHAIEFDEAELLAFYNASMGLAANGQNPGTQKRNDTDSLGGLRTASILR